LCFQAGALGVEFLQGLAYFKAIHGERRFMANSKAGIKTALQIVAAELIKGVFLFGSAGTLRWWQAWLYLASGVFFGILGSAILKESPELLEERKTASKKAKPWDKKIVVLTIAVLPVLLYVTAGLDRRFVWTVSITPVQSLAAFLVLAASTGLFLWAQRVNAFFSSFARIQDDRGQKAVSDGPYKIVRHPAYIGLILGSLAMPVLLGSLPALLVGVVIAGLNVLRTALEDSMLLNELAGYKDYAAKVKYRLIPFVW
jgi:protein-S-isoprenylcysteine O-methyltransferase Ste14